MDVIESDSLISSMVDDIFFVLQKSLMWVWNSSQYCYASFLSIFVDFLRPFEWNVKSFVYQTLDSYVSKLGSKWVSKLHAYNSF